MTTDRVFIENQGLSHGTQLPLRDWAGAMPSASSLWRMVSCNVARYNQNGTTMYLTMSCTTHWIQKALFLLLLLLLLAKLHYDLTRTMYGFWKANICWGVYWSIPEYTLLYLTAYIKKSCQILDFFDQSKPYSFYFLGYLVAFRIAKPSTFLHILWCQKPNISSWTFDLLWEYMHVLQPDVEAVSTGVGTMCRACDNERNLRILMTQKICVISQPIC